MSDLDFFFHYMLVKIALFTGLLFASIAAIPHLDIGLDQELALPKVMDKKDFSFSFFFFFLFAFDKEQVLTSGENLVSDFNQNGISTMK